MTVHVIDYAGHVDVELRLRAHGFGLIRHQIPKYQGQGRGLTPLETLWRIGECIGREWPEEAEDVFYNGTPNLCAGIVIAGIQAGIFQVRAFLLTRGPAGGQIIKQIPRPA